MNRLTLLLTLFLVLFGCRTEKKGSTPFNLWPAINAEADSLTALIEYQLMIDRSTDSLPALFERLEKSGGKAATKRLRYFEAYNLRHLSMNDSALALLRELKTATDSVNEPYLTAKINHQLSLLDDNYPATYQLLLKNIDLFKRMDDSVMLMWTYNDLSYIMFKIYDDSKALHYCDMQIDLARRLGLNSVVTRANINKAVLLGYVGGREAADSLSRLLLADSVVVADAALHEMALRNYHLLCGDEASLRQAIAIARGDTSLRALLPLDYALLSDHHFAKGHTDSALLYGHKAHDLRDLLRSNDHRALLLGIYSRTLEAEGRSDSALTYYKLATALNDSLRNVRDAERLHNLEMNNQIRQYEIEVNAAKERERFLWTIGILALSLIGLAALYILRRRAQASQIEKMKARLELEQLNRSMAARSLAMEEKENLLAETSRRLRRMIDETASREQTLRDLDHLLRVHNSGADEWENFETLFEKVNPDFTRKLKTLYPDLPETSVKLATYIFAGMSTAQIARMTMVRTESVRQARWRLRKKLGLPEDTTLEDFLRGV